MNPGSRLTRVTTTARQARTRRAVLYGPDGVPGAGFNRLVLRWLNDDIQIREHKPPAAFSGLRAAYDAGLAALVAAGAGPREAHAQLLSNLTAMMLGDDLRAILAPRLAAANINTGGFRTALAQGIAKNSGENFTNSIVYALANLLAGQEEILVDKGPPPALRERLLLERTFTAPDGTADVMHMPIEVDACIFRRDDPTNAIIISAKTRLKEVLHVGTMWKILFDTIGDPHTLGKWGLTSGDALTDTLYVFAAADMIAAGGTRTQGPDIGDEVRNLIRADASFFDYVFVSKTGLRSVAGTLDLVAGREGLFHELGLLITLVEQKFGIDLGGIATPAPAPAVP